MSQNPTVSFVRSKKIVYRLSGDIEFLELEARVKGHPQPDTGMVLNLMHLDDTLSALSQLLAKVSYPTLKEALHGAYNEFKRLLEVYQISQFEIAFKFPQLGTVYYFNGQSIRIEIEKFMRFQDQFGRAKVGFDFDNFNKLPDRERRQDSWIMSMAETPTLALKGKFPYGLYWEFSDLISSTVDRLERI